MHFVVARLLSIAVITESPKPIPVKPADLHTVNKIKLRQRQTYHRRCIVAKAHARANAIHRCIVSRNINLLMCAYLVYVRPLLEYNSTTWSPHLKQDIDANERVQRRFTKRLLGLGN